jgi:outer membrane protein OmpA-like peptidoglycan-associated protein
MQKYTGFSLNAWPAFADVMLSVVLVLVMILVLAVATMTGPSYLEVDASQKAIRQAIESKSKNGETFKEDGSNTWRMAFGMEDDTRSEIKVVDEALLQRFTFGAGVLFESDEDTLNARGADLIMQIGKSIVQELARIREVQIHGHTDNNYERKPDETVEFGEQYNLDLASRRAANVFQQLREAGINPVTNLMSIASYGQFSPVSRNDTDDYDADRLAKDNKGDLAEQNRRIELLLHFHDPNVVIP